MEKIDKKYYNNLLSRKLYLQPDGSIVAYDYIKLNSLKNSYSFFYCRSIEECVHKLITNLEKDIEHFLSILFNLYENLKINTNSNSKNKKSTNNILDISIHNIINIIHEIEDLDEFESFLIKILNKDIILNNYGDILIIFSSSLIDAYYELLLLSINRINFLENYNHEYNSKNIYSQISRMDEGMGYKGNKGPYNHMPGPYSNFDIPYDRVSPAHHWGENDGHAHLKFKSFIRRFKQKKQPVAKYPNKEESASLLFNPHKRHRRKNKKFDISQNGRLGHSSTKSDPAKHVWYHGENNPYLWDQPENNTYKSWRNYAY